MQRKIDVRDLFSVYGDFCPPWGETECKDGNVVFSCSEYELISKTTAHSSGVFERKDSFRNVSGKTLTLSAALSKFTFYGGDYEVYTQVSEWANENVGKWQPLVTEIGGQNDDIRMNNGTPPFFALYNAQTGRGTVFHILADSKWQFRVKHRFIQTPFKSDVVVELGINERDFSYSLKDGETLEFPTILYYEFENKRDLDAYKLHRYAKDKYPARSMPIVYNSWMYRFDDIHFDMLSAQLKKAKELGVEYFVIDAGWFGKAGDWEYGVGDWNEYTAGGLCGRMAEFADTVRANGLKFGLWFEIERASIHSQNVKNHPEYYLIEDGCAFVDFSNPQAVDFIFDLLADRIRKYGIEYIKFDYNKEITYDRLRASFLQHFKGYRSFIERIRKTFPNLYMENCASGGMRMALANLRGFDSFWMSDNHSLYAQLQIYKNTILRMPCRALEHWITVESLENFRGSGTDRFLGCGDGCWGHVEGLNESFLRNAIVGGPIGLSCDLTSFSDTALQMLKEVLANYKVEKDFWMNAECHILTDTEGMLVLQFNDEKFEKIKIYVYDGKWHQRVIKIYPVYCKNAEYRVNEEIYSEKELHDHGIDVEISTVNTAVAVELIKI